MARLRNRPAALGALSIVLGAFLLSSCSNAAAIGAARQACTQVERSLTTYGKVASAPSPSASATLRAKAQSQLLSGLHFAAAATSADGGYNSLMTTISEASRVPEGLLVPSLRRQCQVIRSANPFLTQ